MLPPSQRHRVVPSSSSIQGITINDKVSSTIAMHPLPPPGQTIPGASEPACSPLGAMTTSTTSTEGESAPADQSYGPRFLRPQFRQYRGTKRGIEVPSDPVFPASLEAPSPTRAIARIRSSKRLKIDMAKAGDESFRIQRDGSPQLSDSSSPVKSGWADYSGDIHNFHLTPMSDDESDTETSPSVSRPRVVPPAGPSPLHHSFSTSAQEATSDEMDIELPDIAPVSLTNDTPVRTRARALVEKSEIEDLGTELNKVFMLVHGRGLGMGTSGAARGRRSSGLRPKDSCSPSPMALGSFQCDAMLE